jgi:hypothetical protein
LPGTKLGHRPLVLSARIHSGLGNALSLFVAVFDHHLKLRVTPGGLIRVWCRLQAILFAWFLEIQVRALDSAFLHGDDSGRRGNGKTHWLWCFATTDWDAIRLKKREEVPAEAYVSRRNGLMARLDELIAVKWEDKVATRLIERLRRHRDELLTSLDESDVPFDNSHHERVIRPAVQIRNNTFGNRSDRVADAQAVLMSVYRTLQQRRHAPLKGVVEVLTTYLKTGKLPPLPSKVAAVG